MVADTTKDALFDGALSITQPARSAGYRVNVDAILLAAFAARDLDDEVTVARRLARHTIDLGSGVGAVGLSLLHLGGSRRVTMIEIDERLAALARLNAEDNHLADQLEVLHASVDDSAATAHLSASADLVVCNPPYVVSGRGRPPHERVRGARVGDLDIFVDAARRFAGKRARVCFVYPTVEMTTLLGKLRLRGLEPKRVRLVHPSRVDPARVALVECAPSGRPGGLVIEAPFVEMDRPSTRGAAPPQRTAALRVLLKRPRRE